jgi:hypothetical protein
MTADFTEASSTLARCKCGSKAIMRYDPGCTYIVCIAERETKLAISEWNPKKLAEKWNNEQ